MLRPPRAEVWPCLLGFLFLIVVLGTAIMKDSQCDVHIEEKTGGPEDSVVRRWTCTADHFAMFNIGEQMRHRILLCGYGLVGLGVLAYFCCESSPIHRSQETESAFIVALLAIIAICTAVVCMFQKDTPYNDRNVLLLMVLMCFRLARVVATPKCLPEFYDNATDASQRLASQLDNMIKMAKDKTLIAHCSRLSADLSTAISDVLAAEAGAFVELPEGCFTLILLVIMMLLQAVNHLDRLKMFWVDYHATYWVMIVASVVLAAAEFRRYTTVGPRKRDLDRIIKKLIYMGRHVDAEDHTLAIEYVLSRVSVGTLMEVSLQSTCTGLITIALENGLLNVTSKSIIIDAMMKRGMRVQVRRQEVVRDIMKSTHGRELTTLKNMIDFGGDYHNLHKLVFVDIANHDIRNDLLQHFEREAASVRSKDGPHGIKVLSDVDDTLYSSGGHFPAGCDKIYPKHVVYPGCTALYKALDTSFQQNIDFNVNCNLIFLSARPHIYKDVSEEHSYRLFRSLVLEGRMHTFPTLIPGQLMASLRGALLQACMGTRSWEAAGQRKFDCFEQFAMLHGEYDFVFMGDNGQGDLYAGQKIVAHDDVESSDEEAPVIDRAHSRVRCVLIHEVMSEDQCLTVERPKERADDWKEQLAKNGLFFHRTYVGAAVVLHRYMPDVMTVEKLGEVVHGAIQSFQYGVQMYPAWNWEQARAHLQADIDAANEVLSPHWKPEEINLQEVIDTNTPFGFRHRTSSRSSPSNDSDGSSFDDFDETFA